MSTPTYDLIASSVLTTGTPEVVFSSIPATYRDLVLVTSAPSGSSPNQLVATLNSDTGFNYPGVTMSGNGSTASSSGLGNNNFVVGIRGAAQPTVTIVQIMDYSATDKHKTILSRQNSSEFLVRADAVRYPSTSAVSQINIEVSVGGDIQAGTSFHLYGIVA